MTDPSCQIEQRYAIANKLIEMQREQSFRKGKCFIGFDGFTDEIISVVDTRTSGKEFQRIETIGQFGKRISAAAEKSTNIELVPLSQKIGGNAPIMADALLVGGYEITFVGAIGMPGSIEPLFENLASRCYRVFSLCPSAHTDALEFKDGKLILGKHSVLSQINCENLLKAIPKEKLIELFNESLLFASVNWTMILSMNDIWEYFLTEILPHTNLKNTLNTDPRWMFVDLADPAKRTDEDLRGCLHKLLRFKKYYRVVLSLNEAEALRIGKICGKDFTQDTKPDLPQLAEYMYQQTQLHQVVLHAKKYAVAVTPEGTFYADGPFCANPKLTTGAGDNFNAGYCNGLLQQLAPIECLISGCATSGFYVRYGRSPQLEELTQFLRDWNNGTLDCG